MYNCMWTLNISFFHLASSLASIYQLYIYFFFTKNILSKYCCLSSGRYNTVPLNRWSTNNRNGFLTVLEAGSLRSGGQYSCVSWENSFKLQTAKHLLHPQMEGRGQESFPEPPCVRELITFIRIPSSWPNYPPKDPNS